MTYEEYKSHRKKIQEDGCLLLLERKHACLFFKPGKGKTFPCIDAVREVEAKSDRRINVLVLSTADSIKNMWLAEIDPQHCMPRNTVYLSFTSAIQDKRRKQLLSVQWDIIVVDECHKIKAHNTQISKLVFLLSRTTEYVFGLTGTPRGNSDLDIYCQFHNMRISDWGDISYTQFISVVCETQDMFIRGMRIPQVSGIKQKYKAGWERQVAMYSLTMDYDDEDDMPALNEHVVILPYEPSREYLNLQQNIIDIPEYEYRKTLTKLVAVSKAHQAANGFMYVSNDYENTKQTYVFERNAKLDWLHDNIQCNDVIVYLYQQDLVDITTQLNNDNITWTELVSEYKSGAADVLVLQCSKCESFNLQEANRLIFYTLDHSYIKYDQMIHRLWRIGQTKDVEVIVLINDCVVERSVWQTVSNKKTLSDLFFAIRDEVTNG